MSASAAAFPDRPLVLARRWDQLGGRLSAMVNAAALAEVFELRYAFVWPRGVDAALDQPEMLFERTYLEAHELAAEVIDGRPVIPDHELLLADRGDAERRLARAGCAVVDVNQIFDIARLPGEPAAAARTRFARCWSAIGWSAEVRALMERCARVADGRELTAVHARAGDIVDGDWRHSLVHEKYLPTAFVAHAVEVLGAQGPVLILSDNPSLLSWLRARVPAALTAGELIPGYAALSGVHRALADIALLSHCRTIVGPPSSAFSRLAANLGPGAVLRADKLAPAGEERELLLGGVAARRAEGLTDNWRQLLARDLSWYLDVFGRELAPAQAVRVAREAEGLDRDFSGAAARLARSAALAGDLPAAERAAARAMALAEPVELYFDALLEALASRIVVHCCIALRTPDGERATRCVRRCEADFQRTFAREPFWADPARVRTELRRMIDTARGVRTDAPSPVPEPLEAPDDIQAHRATTFYDPLTRDLRAIADRLIAASPPLKHGVSSPPTGSS